MQIQVTLTWDGNDIVAHDNGGALLTTLRDQDPITSATDSWLFAGVVADALGMELDSVDHDGEYIHATLSS